MVDIFYVNLCQQNIYIARAINPNYDLESATFPQYGIGAYVHINREESTLH